MVKLKDVKLLNLTGWQAREEVWFGKNNKITFYELQSEGYTEITHSNFLRNLTSEILEKFVNQGLTQSPLVIEADFLEQIPVL